MKRSPKKRPNAAARRDQLILRRYGHRRPVEFVLGDVLTLVVSGERFSIDMGRRAVTRTPTRHLQLSAAILGELRISAQLYRTRPHTWPIPSR